MPAPTVTFPVTGTGPYGTTKEAAEGAINDAFAAQQSEIDGKATAAQGGKADTAVQPEAINNVDNTADVDKPISGPQQMALDAKADTESLSPVATSGDSDDLTEGVSKLLMTAAERAISAQQQMIEGGDIVAGFARDTSGRVAVAVHGDGSVSMRRRNEEIVEVGGEPDRYIRGVKDPNGRLSFGLRGDGSVFANLSDCPGAPVARSDLRGLDGKNVWGALQMSGVLNRFLSDADGNANAGGATASYVQRRDLPSTTSVLEVAVWRVVLSFGQSLGVGGTDSGDPDPAYSTSAPDPRQGLMLSTGVRGSGSTAVFDASAATDVVGAFEQLTGTQSETPGTGYLRQRIAADKARGNARAVYLYHAAGAGGQNIDALAVGTQPYLNLLAALDQIIALAEIYGARVEVAALNFTHGEANSATDPAIYGPKVSAIMTDFRAECAARSVAPSGGVLLMMDQVSTASSGAGGSAGRFPNIAFFDIEVSDALAHVSTSKYFLQTTDGVHLSAPHNRIFGEYIAKAADAVANDGDWTGCRIIDGAIVGSTIEVDVHVPVGDLVSDTTTIPANADGALGFVYEDDSDSAAITGVTIGATVANICKVTLQLDGVPVGANPKISYAYKGTAFLDQPNFGVVGNLRDSDTTPSSVPASDAGTGYLENWLLIQPPLDL